MSIQYDYKMHGLLVDVTEEEMQKLAKEVCQKYEQEDLLDKDINHITYCLPVPEKEQKKKACFWFVLVVFIWILTLTVMFSGLYQIGRWIIGT